MPSKKNVEFKDYIDYKPEFVIYVTKEQMKIIDKFRVIIKALRGKYMTVKEIHDLYYDKEKKKHEYSIKTIYRYLDELEEAKLVAVAGHRVTKGSRVLEKLYTRTALIFNITMDEEYTQHKRKYYSELSEKVTAVISSIYDKPDLDKTNFKNELVDYFLTTKANHETIMDTVKENPELIEMYSKMDIDSINILDSSVALLMTILTESKLIEQFRKYIL